MWRQLNTIKYSTIIELCSPMPWHMIKVDDMVMGGMPCCANFFEVVLA